MQKVLLLFMLAILQCGFINASEANPNKQPSLKTASGPAASMASTQTAPASPDASPIQTREYCCSGCVIKIIQCLIRSKCMIIPPSPSASPQNRS